MKRLLRDCYIINQIILQDLCQHSTCLCHQNRDNASQRKEERDPLAENENLKKENENQKKEIEDLKKENIQVKTILSMKTKEAEEIAKMNNLNDMANMIKNNINLKKRIRELEAAEKKAQLFTSRNKMSMLQLTPTR